MAGPSGGARRSPFVSGGMAARTGVVFHHNRKGHSMKFRQFAVGALLAVLVIAAALLIAVKHGGVQ